MESFGVLACAQVRYLLPVDSLKVLLHPESPVGLGLLQDPVRLLGLGFLQDPVRLLGPEHQVVQEGLVLLEVPLEQVGQPESA